MCPVGSRDASANLGIEPQRSGCLYVIIRAYGVRESHPSKQDHRPSGACNGEHPNPSRVCTGMQRQKMRLRPRKEPIADLTKMDQVPEYKNDLTPAYVALLYTMILRRTVQAFLAGR